jgi:hypothetical protein
LKNSRNCVRISLLFISSAHSLSLDPGSITRAWVVDSQPESQGGALMEKPRILFFIIDSGLWR